MAITAAYIYPEFWYFAGVQGRESSKLSLQMSGILLQTISALMLALRIFRGPDVEQRKKDHDRLMALLSEDFNRNLKSKTSQAHLEIIHHPEKVNEIKSYYSAAFNFGETERLVAIAGLLMFAVGALLQLVSAG
ncbi:hypothetical protein [Stutzerimonas zhaodongensis]|jgi:hypothetical protein|uniref:Uncharacterized protein n=1 Tax=Stutzerimonas zhaodongensis TaxID=1176257 RepID=A0ABX8J0X7_9GAMM|nr:hypothetical protein [Stutzerimonas zhaodongensis]QWV18829.1 hypothetical protein KQ248_09375 [Stutzerimonas zhaodongensis]